MYSATGIEQIISSIDNTSKTVTLLDNSKWEVSNIHSYKIRTWLQIHKVIIEKQGGSYHMTNINNDDTIDVKLLP